MSDEGMDVNVVPRGEVPQKTKNGHLLGYLLGRKSRSLGYIDPCLLLGDLPRHVAFPFHKRPGFPLFFARSCMLTSRLALFLLLPHVELPTSICFYPGVISNLMLPLLRLTSFTEE